MGEKPVDATQELLVLGVGNVLGSFVSAMPITASFSRSGVNNASGVKSPGAGIFASLLCICALVRSMECCLK